MLELVLAGEGTGDGQFWMQTGVEVGGNGLRMG